MRRWVDWETALPFPNQPPVVLDGARQWQAAEKIVLSRTRCEPRSARTPHAGLFDEFQRIVCPVIAGGGKRFFPDGVRLDLALIEERRFDNGVVVPRYVVCG